MDQVQKTLLTQRTHSALLELCGQRVKRDSDGDWSITLGSRSVFIRPTLNPLPHLLIFSGVIQHSTTDCLGELNDLNAAAAWCKFVRSPAGGIFVVHQIVGEAISSFTISLGIDAVSTCANDAADLLQAVYGTDARKDAS